MFTLVHNRQRDGECFIKSGIKHVSYACIPAGGAGAPPLPTLMQVGKTHKLKLSGVNYYKYLMFEY